MDHIRPCARGPGHLLPEPPLLWNGSTRTLSVHACFSSCEILFEVYIDTLNDILAHHIADAIGVHMSHTAIPEVQISREIEPEVVQSSQVS